jgi:hypothetical protein
MDILGNDLLSALGQRLGLELSFNEERQCLFQLDELMISIRKRQNNWIMYGMLEEVSTAEDSEYLNRIMNINFSLLEKRSGGVALRSQSLLYVDSFSLPVRIEKMWDNFTIFIQNYEEILNKLASIKGESRQNNFIPRDSHVYIRI